MKLFNKRSLKLFLPLLACSIINGGIALGQITPTPGYTTVSPAPDGTIEIRSNTPIRGGWAVLNRFSQFNVNAGQTVNMFTGPNVGTTNTVINVVNGPQSVINGTINLRYGDAGYPGPLSGIGGNLIFINRNGIITGAGSVINAGSILLSTSANTLVTLGDGSRVDINDPLNDSAFIDSAPAPQPIVLNGLWTFSSITTPLTINGLLNSDGSGILASANSGVLMVGSHIDIGNTGEVRAKVGGQIALMASDSVDWDDSNQILQSNSPNVSDGGIFMHGTLRSPSANIITLVNDTLLAASNIINISGLIDADAITTDANGGNVILAVLQPLLPGVSSNITIDSAGAGGQGIITANGNGTGSGGIVEIITPSARILNSGNISVQNGLSTINGGAISVTDIPHATMSTIENTSTALVDPAFFGSISVADTAVSGAAGIVSITGNDQTPGIKVNNSITAPAGSDLKLFSNIDGSGNYGNISTTSVFVGASRAIEFKGADINILDSTVMATDGQTALYTTTGNINIDSTSVVESINNDVYLNRYNGTLPMIVTSDGTISAGGGATNVLIGNSSDFPGNSASVTLNGATFGPLAGVYITSTNMPNGGTFPVDLDVAAVDITIAASTSSIVPDVTGYTTVTPSGTVPGLIEVWSNMFISNGNVVLNRFSDFQLNAGQTLNIYLQDQAGLNAPGSVAVNIVDHSGGSTASLIAGTINLIMGNSQTDPIGGTLIFIDPLGMIVSSAGGNINAGSIILSSSNNTFVDNITTGIPVDLNTYLPAMPINTDQLGFRNIIEFSNIVNPIDIVGNLTANANGNIPNGPNGITIAGGAIYINSTSTITSAPGTNVNLGTGSGIRWQDSTDTWEPISPINSEGAIIIDGNIIANSGMVDILVSSTDPLNNNISIGGSVDVSSIVAANPGGRVDLEVTEVAFSGTAAILLDGINGGTSGQILGRGIGNGAGGTVLMRTPSYRAINVGLIDLRNGPSGGSPGNIQIEANSGINPATIDGVLPNSFLDAASLSSILLADTTFDPGVRGDIFILENSTTPGILIVESIGGISPGNQLVFQSNAGNINVNSPSINVPNDIHFIGNDIVFNGSVNTTASGSIYAETASGSIRLPNGTSSLSTTDGDIYFYRNTGTGLLTVDSSGSIDAGGGANIFAIGNNPSDPTNSNSILLTGSTFGPLANTYNAAQSYGAAALVPTNITANSMDLLLPAAPPPPPSINIVADPGVTYTHVNLVGGIIEIRSDRYISGNNVILNRFSNFDLGATQTANIYLGDGTRTANTAINIVNDPDGIPSQIAGTLNLIAGNTAGSPIGGNLIFIDPYGIVSFSGSSINASSVMLATSHQTRFPVIPGFPVTSIDVNPIASDAQLSLYPLDPAGIIDFQNMTNGISIMGQIDTTTGLPSPFGPNSALLTASHISIGTTGRLTMSEFSQVGMVTSDHTVLDRTNELLYSAGALNIDGPIWIDGRVVAPSGNVVMAVDTTNATGNFVDLNGLVDVSATTPGQAGGSVFINVTRPEVDSTHYGVMLGSANILNMGRINASGMGAGAGGNVTISTPSIRISNYGWINAENGITAINTDDGGWVQILASPGINLLEVNSTATAFINPNSIGSILTSNILTPDITGFININNPNLTSTIDINTNVTARPGADLVFRSDQNINVLSGTSLVAGKNLCLSSNIVNINGNLTSQQGAIDIKSRSGDINIGSGAIITSDNGDIWLYRHSDTVALDVTSYGFLRSNGGNGSIFVGNDPMNLTNTQAITLAGSTFGPYEGTYNYAQNISVDTTIAPNISAATIEIKSPNVAPPPPPPPPPSPLPTDDDTESGSVTPHEEEIIEEDLGGATSTVINNSTNYSSEINSTNPTVTNVSDSDTLNENNSDAVTYDLGTDNNIDETAINLSNSMTDNTGDYAGSTESKADSLNLPDALKACNAGQCGNLISEDSMGGQLIDVLLKGYSFDQEYEADNKSVQYTLKADYDPEGLEAFLKTLKGLEDSIPKGSTARGSSSLSGYKHPPTDTRIEKVQKEITLEGAKDNVIKDNDPKTFKSIIKKVK